MYKLAVFDMDGTILDTLEDLKNSLNYALTEHQMPTRTLDEVRRFVGNGIGKLIERGIPEGSGEAEYRKVLDTFMPHYTAHCNDCTRPYDGVVIQIHGCISLRCPNVWAKYQFVMNKCFFSPIESTNSLLLPTLIPFI